MMEMFGTGFGVPIVIGAAIGFMIGRPGIVYRYARLEAQTPAEEGHAQA